MNIAEARTAEHEKYTRCYKQPNYRMGVKRMQDAVRILEEITTRGSYLVVGHGRGGLLSFALFPGFNPVRGPERDCVQCTRATYGARIRGPNGPSPHKRLTGIRAVLFNRREK